MERSREKQAAAYHHRHYTRKAPPVSIVRCGENLRNRRSNEATTGRLDVPRYIRIKKAPEEHREELSRIQKKKLRQFVSSALTIQTFWRSVYAQQCYKLQRNKAIEAVMKIQAMIRRMIRNQRMMRAVVTIQASMRGYLLRRSIVERIFQFNQMIHDAAAKKKKRREHNHNVRFDESKTCWYPDRCSQRERNQLYYKSQDLQSFRSESRHTFMQWFLKSGYENKSFLCDSLHDDDHDEENDCLRGLEHYHREHTIDHTTGDRPGSIPQRVVQFQKCLQPATNKKKAKSSGSSPAAADIAIQHLADYYTKLNQDAIVQSRERAIHDEKVAKMVHQQPASTTANNNNNNKQSNNVKSSISRFLSHFSPKVTPKKLTRRGRSSSPLKSPTDVQTSIFNRYHLVSNHTETPSSSSSSLLLDSNSEPSRRSKRFLPHFSKSPNNTQQQQPLDASLSSPSRAGLSVDATVHSVSARRGRGRQHGMPPPIPFMDDDD